MTRIVAVAWAWLVALAAFAQAASPPWIAQSNELAHIPLAVFARYFPEQASQLGLPEADRDVLDLRPRAYERYVADVRKAADALRAKAAETSDPRVRQDLEIMIKAQDDAVATAVLRRRLLLENIDVAQTAFYGIRVLLDPQIPKERQSAALARLRRYAGVEPGTVPLTRLAIDRTEERLAQPGLTGPYVNEVDKALGTRSTTSTASGISSGRVDSTAGRSRSPRWNRSSAATATGCAATSCRGAARRISFRRKSTPTT